MKKLIGCVALVAAVSVSAFGELSAKNWNGGAAGDWGVAANWEPEGAPAADAQNYGDCRHGGMAQGPAGGDEDCREVRKI